jgi:hypothetical protein
MIRRTSNGRTVSSLFPTPFNFRHGVGVADESIGGRGTRILDEWTEWIWLFATDQ